MVPGHLTAYAGAFVIILITSDLTALIQCTARPQIWVRMWSDKSDRKLFVYQCFSYADGPVSLPTAARSYQVNDIHTVIVTVVHKIVVMNDTDCQIQ